MAGLSEQDQAKYTNYFMEVVQSCGAENDEICLEDFEQLLKNCGHRLTREAVVSVFVSADTDGDWKLGLQDFLNFLSTVSPSGSQESIAAAIRCQFEKNDVNKDGYISLDELREVLAAVNCTLDEQWIQEFMQQFDTDGDGRLNFEEFVTMFVKTQILDVDEEDDEAEKRETEAAAAKLTDIILSADGIRTMCNERGLVEDGSVPVVELRSILTEVKVQMSEEDVERSIQELDRNGDGRINLDEFVAHFEDVTTLDTEEAEPEVGEVNGNAEEVAPVESEAACCQDEVEVDITREEEEEVAAAPTMQQEPEETRVEEVRPVETSNGTEATRDRSRTDTEVSKLSKTFEGQKPKRQTSCGDDGASQECKGVGVRGLIAKWNK